MRRRGVPASPKFCGSRRFGLRDQEHKLVPKIRRSMNDRDGQSEAGTGSGRSGDNRAMIEGGRNETLKMQRMSAEHQQELGGKNLDEPAPRQWLTIG